MSGRPIWWALLVLVVAIAIWRLQAPSGQPAPSTSPTPGATESRSVASSRPTTASPPSPAPSGWAAPNTPIAVLVGAGDIAECDDVHDSETADLVEDIGGVVFTLGDNAYENGTLAEFQDCYGPTWGRPSIKDRTMPVAGNHEYQTPGAEGYFGYFGAAAGDPDAGWYAYDAGTWRIYVINSNCGEVGGCEAGSAQERWLREDLAAKPRACVAAMWHHPRFSSGEHGNNDGMADIWRTLQDAGAELVLAGHDHTYERFTPQTATGSADPALGIVEFVVGTGGRDPHSFRAPLEHSLVRESPVFGVLRLDLRPEGYDFGFIAVPGDDFTDSGSAMCH